MEKLVQKSTPEEAAVIANIASMLQQLQAMGVGDQSFDQGAPQDQNLPPAQPPKPVQAAANTGEEEFPVTPEASSTGEPEDQPQKTAPQEPARRPQMKNVQQIQKSDDEDIDDKDQEVEKAIQASEDEGVTATDDTEEKLDDLPETTQENVKEIKKALSAIGFDVVRRKPVRKSAGVSGGEIAELRQQMAFLANTVSEVIEGLSVTKSLEFEDPADFTDTKQVRKGARPSASYSGQGDISDVLKALVQEIRGDRQQEDLEANPWNKTDVVHKSMRTFTNNLRSIAGGLWPNQQ